MWKSIVEWGRPKWQYVARALLQTHTLRLYKTRRFLFKCNNGYAKAP